MKLPKPGSLKDKICVVLSRNHSKTITEVHQLYSHVSRRAVDQAIYQLADIGALSRVGRRYSMTPEWKAYYDTYQPVEEIKVIQVRPDGFREWSGKFSFTHAPRREPIRTDVSFVNGSSVFQPLYGA